MFSSWPDLVNGLFELSGGFFVLLSVIQTIKDKQVHGVNWLTTAFFASWGLWNLFFYAHLEQWASWLGGLLLVVVNIWWVILLIYYKKKPGGKKGLPKAPRPTLNYTAPIIE